MFVVLISVRGWVDNRAIVRPEWIGNRTLDLPACSAVPQPSAPRVPTCSIHSLLVQYPRHVIRYTLTKVFAWYKPAITGIGYSNLMESGTVKHFSVKRQYTVLVLSLHVHSVVRFISTVSNSEFCLNLLSSCGWDRAHPPHPPPSARPALHKSLIPMCNNEEPEVGFRMVGYKTAQPSQATIAYCSFNSRRKMRRNLIFFVFTVFFMLLLRKFTAVPLRCGVTSRFTILYNSTQVWDGVVLAGCPMMWMST
jgi:hypothetical protein